MSNYRLHTSTSSVDLRVTDLGNLHNTRARTGLEQALEDRAYLVGDQEEAADPVQFTVLITAATERAARASIKELHTACLDAVRLERLGNSTHRALHAGVTTFRATPLGQRATQWRVQVGLLPKFPRWTTTSATTLSLYEAASKA